MIKKWKLLSVKKENIGHKWYPLELREYLNQNGKKTEWVLSPSSGVVVVFALTKDKKVILGKQYRPGIDMIEFSPPAGGIKPNSTALQNAKWELEEESGYVSKNWKYLGKIARSAGKSSGWQYMYLARDCEKMTQKLDEDEFIEVHEVSLLKFQQMLKKGDVKDMGCAFTAYKALEYLRSLGSVKSK